MLFEALKKISERPKPFEFYTAEDLWTDKHTSRKMLSYHLNEEVDISSRNMRFIERSVEWIADRFKIAAGSKVADFGCGPGLYTARLAAKGASVTGIDFSERSIRHAREVVAKSDLHVDYVHCNYLEYNTDERFDLIMMIMCDFCALSPAQRKDMLARFHTMLKPSGYVLLDVYSLKAFAQKEESARFEKNLLDGFWSPNEYYGFLHTFKYEVEKVTLDKYTLVEAGRTRTVYNWLQFFSPETLEKEFDGAGFRVAERYAGVAGDAFDPKGPEFAVVACRK